MSFEHFSDRQTRAIANAYLRQPNNLELQAATYAYVTTDDPVRQVLAARYMQEAVRVRDPMSDRHYAQNSHAIHHPAMYPGFWPQ